MAVPRSWVTHARGVGMLMSLLVLKEHKKEPCNPCRKKGNSNPSSGTLGHPSTCRSARPGHIPRQVRECHPHSTHTWDMRRGPDSPGTLAHRERSGSGRFEALPDRRTGMVQLEFRRCPSTRMFHPCWRRFHLLRHPPLHRNQWFHQDHLCWHLLLHLDQSCHPSLRWFRC